jgi:hypothetical protein
MYIQTTECLLSESVKFMCIPLETGREMSLWRAFLACIAASANKFYFYRHVTYCVYPDIYSDLYPYKLLQNLTVTQPDKTQLLLCLT